MAILLATSLTGRGRGKGAASTSTSAAAGARKAEHFGVHYKRRQNTKAISLFEWEAPRALRRASNQASRIDPPLVISRYNQSTSLRSRTQLIAHGNRQ